MSSRKGDELRRGYTWNFPRCDQIHRVEKRLLSDHVCGIGVIGQNGWQFIVLQIIERIAKQLEILLAKAIRLAIFEISPGIEDCRGRQIRSEQGNLVHTPTLDERAIVEPHLRN